MKLKQAGSNQTVLEIGETQVFFSYETPVAAFVPGRGYLKTDCRWSATTCKHINQYLQGANAIVVPQSELDQLIA